VIKPATRYGFAAAAVLAIVIIAVAASLWLSAQALSASQRHWCTVLNLVTSQPARQSSRPLTAEQAQLARQYFAAIEGLKRQFGC
jgi:hypothetical protein